MTFKWIRFRLGEIAEGYSWLSFPVNKFNNVIDIKPGLQQVTETYQVTSMSDVRPHVKIVMAIWKFQNENDCYKTT